MSCFKTKNIYVIYACMTIYKMTDSKEKAERYLEECKEKFKYCSMSVAIIPIPGAVSHDEEKEGLG